MKVSDVLDPRSGALDSLDTPAQASEPRGTVRDRTPRTPSRSRVLVGGTGVGLGWMLVAWLLRVGPLEFLLLLAPVLVAFQGGVRRRPLRELWARDVTTFAAGPAGKAVVVLILLAVPGWQLVRTVPTWISDGWSVVLLTIVLAVLYLCLHRLWVSVILSTALVAAAIWVLTPHVSDQRSGDPQLLRQLNDQEVSGLLAHQHDLAVAEVDLNATRSVRVANIGTGTDSTTPMEVGSLTKALTGLVIADAVHRGELNLEAPVARYLTALRGSRAGEVTMRELVNHTAGYANFGAATVRGAAWRAPLGRDFLDASRTQMMHEAREQALSTRGTYVYSSLGAAVAGQAAAAAAGMTYPELMQTRLFAPVGMSHTALQTRDGIVAGGRTTSGLPIQPWFLAADAYAPAGAVVSTTGDLAKLAAALINGTAPGVDALRPTSTRVTHQGHTRIGDFWRTSTWGTGQTITWHDGLTAGYSSYFGLDVAHHRAVIILADTGNPATTDLGINLLARTH